MSGKSSPTNRQNCVERHKTASIGQLTITHRWTTVKFENGVWRGAFEGSSSRTRQLELTTNDYQMLCVGPTVKFENVTTSTITFSLFLATCNIITSTTNPKLSTTLNFTTFAYTSIMIGFDFLALAEGCFTSSILQQHCRC